MLKPLFSNIIGSPITAVINVCSKVDRATGGGCPNEGTRVVGTRRETEVKQDRLESLIPVAGTAAEAIEGLLEMPIGTWLGVGASLRGNTDTDLIIRECGVAEGILSITLFDFATFGNS